MSRRRAIWFSGCRRRCKGSNPNRVCQTSGAKPPDFYAVGKLAHPYRLTRAPLLLYNITLFCSDSLKVCL
ncbi:hypothetical protein GCWU000324_00354 [Kingella oralis ATCC 51147]|uniref:Uncharacterized protein n=1 Tax=Kingella oralis ATCC 51147 TaxID=629741 RepID=C4GHM0_9NEIS|nr:hypothetical protein GCWU000324_00354 [Kingella oralis ATCC 51147]